MATHSSILAWRIPWTEKPGVLYSMGSQSVRRNSATKQQLSYFLTEPEQIPYMELNMQVSFKSDVYKQY